MCPASILFVFHAFCLCDAKKYVCMACPVISDGCLVFPLLPIQLAVNKYYFPGRNYKRRIILSPPTLFSRLASVTNPRQKLKTQ